MAREAALYGGQTGPIWTPEKQHSPSDVGEITPAPEGLIP
jgi:hypothetical protein